MKKNPFVTTLRNLTRRMSTWIHAVLEAKGEHLENCAWYPGPCQTEFPY